MKQENFKKPRQISTCMSQHIYSKIFANKSNVKEEI